MFHSLYKLGGADEILDADRFDFGPLAGRRLREAIG
jgi:hypothetical protein